MDIHKQDISDVLAALPKHRELAACPVSDLLICTLGFEDRSHAFVDWFIVQDQNRPHILLIQYPTNKEENEANLRYFLNAGSRLGGISYLQYRRQTFYSDLKAALSGLGLSKETNVVFDVSTCSSYVFYPLMKHLVEADIYLTLVYAEAKEYFPSYDEWREVAAKAIAEAEGTLYVQAFENAAFQSLGVEDIYSLSLYSEMNAGNKASLLLAVPNFSAMRMNAIIARDAEINKTKNSDIIWLIASPPAQRNQWRREAISKTHNLDLARADVQSVCTLNYQEMLKALEDIWICKKHNFQISIAGLGSKMQHLGTFLFLCLHKEVGIWMAEPREFKSGRFSSGASTIWEIPFGPTSNLRAQLSRYMQFKWKL